MKKLALIAVGLASLIPCAWAQAVNQIGPAAVSPKPVTPEATPAASPGQYPIASPRSPEGNKPLDPDRPNLTINAIIIVKSREEIKEAGVSGATGVEVRDIPFLQARDSDFRSRIQPFLGKPLTENNIRDLEDAIILYCRGKGRLLVDVILPEQDISNGVLQLWLLEGKVGKVTIKNEGRKWFTDQFVMGQVHLRPAEPIDSIQLNQDLNWLNNNPFRQVNAVFKPGDTLGVTDVQLDVNDRFPIRPYVGYENTGTRYTGVDRFVAGANLGNVFGLDQQVNYQFTSDIDFNLVTANSGSYIIPLPWRHTLTFFGSYVDARADFGGSGGGTTSTGYSWQTSMRYSIPLPDLQKYRHQISAGFDFKRSNNNLLAGGTTVLEASSTDVDQFVLAYSGIMPDDYGTTSVGAEGYFSPGEMTEYNNNNDFNQLRAEAKSDYFYGRFNAERLTRLPYQFSWVLRGTAQVASQRLLPSEELALGGYSTIRGYDESVVLGDQGWMIDNELRTPPFSLGELLHMPYLQDELQFLGFFDYGAVRVIDAGPQDGSNPNITLYSIGAGVRYTIRKNLTARFDYGWPLTEGNINQSPSRAMFGLLASF